jgi:protocatechuate 3,4-dioxygenase beta subunit
MPNFKIFFMNKILLLAIILFAGCNNNPQDNISSANTDDGNILLLATANEPGKKLTVNFLITDKKTGEPLPNTEVYLYQADTNGEYHPSDPADESTAKLSGVIMSDDSGRFIVKTILPGEYEESGNRHIHIHYARAEGYEQTGGVILFEDNVNDEVRQWANETGFGFIIDVEEINGTLVGHMNLKLNTLNDKPDN